MKTKILSLMFALTFLFSIMAVSAATDVTDYITASVSDELSKTNNEVTLTLTNSDTNPIDVDLSEITLSDDKGNDIAISSSETNPITVPAEDSVEVSLSYDLTDEKKEELIPGVYSTQIEIVNNLDEKDKITSTLKFVSDYCILGEKSSYNLDDENTLELEIKDVDIKSSGEEDLIWKPLDEIEIDIEIENTGDKKIKSVKVELGLYDVNGEEIDMDDLGLKEEKISLSSLDKDEKDNAVFKFKIPSDFGIEETEYKLVIKTYTDYEYEDDVDGEKTLCVSSADDDELEEEYYQSIEVERDLDEEEQLVIGDIVVPETIGCDEVVQVTGKVYNIGNEDYEDRVKVTLYSEELGIDESQVIDKDFDAGEWESLEAFEFTIPKGTEEKTYFLEFRVHYDYDEDDDEYYIVSNKYTKIITVSGNCIIEKAEAHITAELDEETPEAVAGKQVVIKTTLTNTGNKEATYAVSVEGHSTWSSIVSITPQIIKLAPGELKVVNVVLSINPDAEGDKEFSIKTAYDDEVTEQKVQLSVSAKQEGSLITGSSISQLKSHVKSNSFLYLIGIINLILILAIISVVKKSVSGKSSIEESDDF